MPQAQQPRDPKKSFGIVETTFSVVGAILGVAALLNFFQELADLGIYPVLEDLVARYRHAVYAVFGFLDRPLEAVAQFIASLFDWRLDLRPYWKDVFIPIWLYFANSARATHGDRRATYRYALFFLGIIVALLTSVALAGLGTELKLAPALTALTTGVVLYELISYALLLALVEEKERASSPSFWRYVIERPLPTIVLGLLANLVWPLAFADTENTAALALIFFILLLAVRNIALAIFFAVENSGNWPGKFRDRLFRSRSWRLGILVVVTIVVAAAGVVWGG